jgi:hypothetical protein
MKTLWAGVAVVGLLMAPAFAETRYDRKLEQAAIDIVVGKIGDIRGGFTFDARPVFVIKQDAMPTGSIAARNVAVHVDPWRNGLAPAVERRISHITF